MLKDTLRRLFYSTQLPPHPPASPLTQIPLLYSVTTSILGPSPRPEVLFHDFFEVYVSPYLTRE